MAYRSEDRRDRWKAIAAVAAVHAVLALVILNGLDVDIVTRAVDHLQAFDITLPEPPPEEPPPKLQPNRAEREQGAAGKKAEPTEIVAPKPEVRLPTRQPVAAAPVAGTGTASSAGAANAGSGTGAGGTGTGRGGGGTGAGFTPARIIRKIPDSAYRRISAGRVPSGSASLHFVVTPQGRISNCSVVRSSGDSSVDSVLCQVAANRMRFSPARDPSGRAVSQEMTYTPVWRPR